VPDRLAWRCRRGLLELDLWLGGFLAASRATLKPDERNAFERLLAMPDMQIMDMLQGLAQADNADVQALIQRIQTYRLDTTEIHRNEQNSHP
jgi:antitoxin CptB